MLTGIAESRDAGERPPAPNPWRKHRSWLSPDFWDRDAGLLITRVQTFVLRSEGVTILVVTGVGNHEPRPLLPLFARRSTDFLDRPAAAGVAPRDVDVVVDTHLHADHVGWNTRLVDGQWVPTTGGSTTHSPSGGRGSPARS
ncbi:MBL fold metallo-hydrolase [Streptomyces sp. CBMA123]|uniref:MBL fold metallo-hydrolase n=1 Tax=Streptomyces sp. CBMA123 TaxID=1896313 RepID=UPI003982DE58